MTDQTNVPAPLRSLSAIIDEYDAKQAAIPDQIKAFRQSVTDLETASTVGGTYSQPIWGRGGSPSVHQRDLEANLLRSAWKHVYNGLNIPKIATAKDRARYDRELENPPPFTIDNIRANFGDYIVRPRDHILRGLAEVFSSLDPAFKSHSKVKIGVTALPKRVILSGFGEYSHGSYGRGQLRDMLNAMASLDGREHVHDGHVGDITRAARKDGEAMWWGGSLRVFKNGNAHLFFDRHALDIVNRGLAEYYGDVLPDAPDEAAERRPSTEVAKDLQFYPTPADVADHLVARAGIRDGAVILEPSAGEGAILEAVSRYVTANNRTGVWCAAYEYAPDRVAAARESGFPVTQANFLEVPPEPAFDLVLMNPPFYGKHYQKHVEHARRFLKPDGVLYAILPITAVTDHGFVEPDTWGRDKWEDLPVGSFAPSGANINTGIARFFALKGRNND